MLGLAWQVAEAAAVLASAPWARLDAVLAVAPRRTASDGGITFEAAISRDEPAPPDGVPAESALSEELLNLFHTAGQDDLGVSSRV